MQQLYMGTENGMYSDGSLYVAPQRCVRQLIAVLSMGRIWSILVPQCMGRKSGTVVPQCDFHTCSTENPLITRVPRCFLSRIARPSVRAYAIGRVPKIVARVCNTHRVVFRHLFPNAV